MDHIFGRSRLMHAWRTAVGPNSTYILCSDAINTVLEDKASAQWALPLLSFPKSSIDPKFCSNQSLTCDAVIGLKGTNCAWMQMETVAEDEASMTVGI